MFKMLSDPPPDDDRRPVEHLATAARPRRGRSSTASCSSCSWAPASTAPSPTRSTPSCGEWIRIVEERDESTPLARLVLALHDAGAAMEELDRGRVDGDDPAQVELYKTYRMLQNEVIYADSFLRI